MEPVTHASAGGSIPLSACAPHTPESPRSRSAISHSIVSDRAVLTRDARRVNALTARPPLQSVRRG